MSYRINSCKPPQPQRDVQKLSTRGRVFIHNGTTANFAFPCWYQEVKAPEKVYPHSRAYHDFVGQPSPSHPDEICQAYDFATHHHHQCGDGLCGDNWDWILDPDSLIPIHLTEEGYTRAVVKVVKDNGEQIVEGPLTAEAIIDEKEDWVVRVKFAYNEETKELCDNDATPVPYHYSIYVESKDKTDLVATGTLYAVPTAWSAR